MKLKSETPVSSTEGVSISATSIKVTETSAAHLATQCIDALHDLVQLKLQSMIVFIKSYYVVNITF